MAERLKNTLAFSLNPGASVILPHGLMTSLGRPLSPDIIFVPKPSLTVLASTTASVTLRNDGPALVTDVLLVEAWHTVERAFNGAQNVNLPVKPYIVYGGDAVPPAQIRNPFALPEQWIVEALEGDSNGTMNQQVSKNFIGIQMLRAGSLVGIRVRPSTPITTGGATFVPHINGLPVLGLLATLDAGSAPTGASGTAAPGLIPYVAGSIITINYQSTVDWDPICDVEAWLEGYEAI